ncbi:uncharacterized protein LOC122300434 isoform X2 [Carya illinoinensis]|uniref:uncharacterized protein LOC122300434 isoform X2 n=1 Tax=Carya illinoinensis TaxID=32201 RepID=UPI001C71D56F|nr:uncharacterized protein LOC122300434 isoform X2 [Carya illinoinensis]
MANSDSSPSLPQANPLSSKKENITPIGSKISELNESRAELLNRIQGLKQDLQSWRSKLDTQVKVYRDELSELKKSLNVEVEQLRSFQDLRTTLQQQQDDVTSSLKNLGLQDVTTNSKDAQAQDVEGNDKDPRTTLQQQQDDVASSLKNLGLQDVTTNSKDAQAQDCEVEGNDKDGHILPGDKSDKENQMD